MHRVAEGDSKYFYYAQRTGEFIKQAGILAGIILGVVVFAIAHPIIGFIGSIIGLIKAAYHNNRRTYHSLQTCETDRDGNLVVGTELNNYRYTHSKCYMNENAVFNASDLSRLKHELQRLHYEESYETFLKLSRCLAKCIIPVFGPVWAFYSERVPGGFISELYERADEFDLIPKKERVEAHILKLEENTEETA